MKTMLLMTALLLSASFASAAPACKQMKNSRLSANTNPKKSNGSKDNQTGRAKGNLEG